MSCAIDDASSPIEDILSFCTLNYGVSFEMFKKVDVKGKNIHPLFEYLVEKSPDRTGKKVKWNFEKFLIDQNGEIVKRYPPSFEPLDIEEDILALL